MYTARYKLEIMGDGKESSMLFAKFRFGGEVTPKDWEKVKERMLNFWRGSYLIKKGFYRTSDDTGFEKITEEYSALLYPRITLIRMGLNIKANSFGKNLSLDKIINLEEINNLMLTGKIN